MVGEKKFDKKMWLLSKVSKLLVELAETCLAQSFPNKEFPKINVSFAKLKFGWCLLRCFVCFWSAWHKWYITSPKTSFFEWYFPRLSNIIYFAIQFLYSLRAGIYWNPNINLKYRRQNLAFRNINTPYTFFPAEINTYMMFMLFQTLMI